MANNPSISIFAAIHKCYSTAVRVFFLTLLWLGLGLGLKLRLRLGLVVRVRIKVRVWVEVKVRARARARVKVRVKVKDNQQLLELFSLLIKDTGRCDGMYKCALPGQLRPLH